MEKRGQAEVGFEKPITEAIWEYSEESRLVRTYEAVDMEKHILATYYVEVKPHIPLSVAAEHLAAEQSTGTWTPVLFETPETREKYAGKAVRIFPLPEKPNAGVVEIAFPTANIDPEVGGIPALLACVAGNLFGIADLANIRLLDIVMPKEWTEPFPGPKFGIQKIRELVKSDRRYPHIGTIIKPNVGLTPKEHAELVYQAAAGGADFIKDDELLVSPKYCTIEDRASACAEALDKAKAETGKPALYVVNITDRPDKILRNAEKAISNGAPGIMVDFVTAGVTAIQTLAEDPSITVPIHCHRCMHAAFTRNPAHGIDMLVLAKLVRLAGGDQLHTGTAAGKMHGEIAHVQLVNRSLRQEFRGFNTVMPACSGGIHIGNFHWNAKMLGPDVTINFGGGIHGHPDGTKAGAIAVRQAFDALIQGISLEEAAREKKELAKALSRWKYVPIPSEYKSLVTYAPEKAK